MIRIADIDLEDPEGVRLSGDTLTLDTEIVDEDDIDAAIAAKDRLAAMAGRIVPVDWDVDRSVTGWWTLNRAEPALLDTSYDTGWFPMRLQLERVAQASVITSRLAPAARSNAHAVTAGRWWAGPVGTARVDAAGASTLQRQSVDGPIDVYRQIDTDTHPRWQADPAAWADGGCHTEQDNQRAHERRAAADAAAWRLWSPLLTVAPVVAGDGQLEIRWWDGDAWRTYTWQVLVNAVAPVWAACTVLTDRPDVAALRLQAFDPPNTLTVDLSVRRGARAVTVQIRRTSAATLKLVLAGAGEAGTAATGYVRRTANDANGHRWMVGASHAYTADTAAGGVSVAAATLLDALVGLEVDGTGAVAGDQADDVYADWLAPEPTDDLHTRI